MSNLERRANRWYAVLVVPKDVRAAIGKFKYIESTGTEDKHRAQAIAAPILAHWRALIRQARGEGDAVVREALRWREAIAAEQDPDVRDVLEEQVVDRAETIGAARSRELGRDHFGAQRFAEIAFGQSTPLEAWQSQLALAQKTQDQMKKDVALMVERFPTFEAITHQAVKGWLGDLQAKGATDSTRARIVSFCRNYWRYLQHVDAVSGEADPFKGLSSGGGIAGKKKQSGNGRAGWEPFAPSDVVKLWKAAREGKDQQLADLIAVAAQSGARIEELCSLRVSAVIGSTFKITDAKTTAGVREVPTHSNLKGTITRLKKSSKDGYLFSGLGPNKYGDRTNAIGKRFGRLKAALDFGEQHVFHSIRKTFVTLLENVGVSENLAADIVGREKPRVTYGLYSGAASVTVKAAAVEKVKYPAGMAA